ncbi:putative streptomycin biosynthesis operon regulatory protein [Aeromonas phage 1233]|nr:putative streptomycin biosynthesis operon regulatory protein [Aeromonas phage 1233]
MYNAERIENLFELAQEKAVVITQLVLDAGTQCRAKLNKEQAENYAANMLAGKADEFPAVKVARLTESVQMPDGSLLEAGALVLVDGFHRIEGASQAKLETFKAEIVDCTLEDAIYYSMRANNTNGLSFVGKDYQNAIRKLYTLDNAWREHGKKKEIAAMFGCSEKTVQRATAAIDKEIKAEAFKMFEAGATDSDVAAFAVISIQTAANWRKEWEEAKNLEQPDPENPQGSDNEPEADQPKNPMDMTLAQILALKDSPVKAIALKLLMDSIKKDAQAEPEQPQQDDEPPFDKEPEAEAEPQAGVKDDKAAKLAQEWKGKDCWFILGLNRADLDKLANPKAAIKRAFTKALKQCHPDHYGENEACDMLKHAQDEAMKFYR